MLAKAKKWGNSIGLIVPADVVRMEGIRPGDVVDVQIRKRIPSLEELSGTVKLRHTLRDLLREMEEGWDDI